MREDSGLVPRTQRNALFGGALQSRGPCCSEPCGLLGPGSAQQREERCSASGTRERYARNDVEWPVGYSSLRAFATRAGVTSNPALPQELRM